MKEDVSWNATHNESLDCRTSRVEAPWNTGEPLMRICIGAHQIDQDTTDSGGDDRIRQCIVDQCAVGTKQGQCIASAPREQVQDARLSKWFAPFYVDLYHAICNDLINNSQPLFESEFPRLREPGTVRVAMPTPEWTGFGELQA